MIKNAVRVLLATCLLAGVLLVGAGPTSAAGLNVECTAAGTVVVVDDPITGLTSWTIAGRGTCFGNLAGTYFLDFQGAGTSKGLGLCGSSGVVQDLQIAVTGTLAHTTTGVVRPIIQSWHAPVTTFPMDVPVLIGSNGAGLIQTRTFGKCPPEGTPTALFHLTIAT